MYGIASIHCRKTSTKKERKEQERDKELRRKEEEKEKKKRPENNNNRSPKYPNTQSAAFVIDRETEAVRDRCEPI